MRSASWWLGLAIVVCFAAGALIGYAIVSPRPFETPEQHQLRCWGWYEGTYGGRQGADCPPWWPDDRPEWER